MKALPVIIAVVVLGGLIRVGLRRRGPSSRIGVVVARFRGRGLLGDTGLVAGREIREQVRGLISAADTSAGARYVRAMSVTLGAQRAFTQAGLTPQQAATVAKAKPVPVESIQPGKKPRTTAEATALLGVILIFIVLMQYLTWTLMGVMEEKASRVVEVLLATVRPIQLLAGKVMGIGAVALAQAVALVAFALV